MRPWFKADQLTDGQRRNPADQNKLTPVVQRYSTQRPQPANFSHSHLTELPCLRTAPLTHTVRSARSLSICCRRSTNASHRRRRRWCSLINVQTVRVGRNTNVWRQQMSAVDWLVETPLCTCTISRHQQGNTMSTTNDVQAKSCLQRHVVIVALSSNLRLSPTLNAHFTIPHYSLIDKSLFSRKFFQAVRQDNWKLFDYAMPLVV